MSLLQLGFLSWIQLALESKYFSVVAVIVAIFFGIVVFLVVLDRKIRRIENKLEDGQH